MVPESRRIDPPAAELADYDRAARARTVPGQHTPARSASNFGNPVALVTGLPGDVSSPFPALPAARVLVVNMVANRGYVVKTFTKAAAAARSPGCQAPGLRPAARAFLAMGWRAPRLDLPNGCKHRS